MLLRTTPLLSVIFLAACSSNAVKHTEAKRSTAPTVKYAKYSSRIVPVNSVASSNNRCVDSFNFLRQAGDNKYQKYSRDYIKVGDGYTFLNVNKNIMGEDAKRVYTMKLDMKLDTLCSEVDYAGYQVIQQKVKALYGI